MSQIPQNSLQHQGTNDLELLMLLDNQDQDESDEKIIRPSEDEQITIQLNQLEDIVIRKSRLIIDDSSQKPAENSRFFSPYERDLDKWTLQQIELLLQLDLNSDQTLLDYFFYLPLPNSKLDLLLLQDQSLLISLIDLIFTQDILQSLLNHKLLFSLFVPLFPNSSGQLLYYAFSQLKYRPDSQLKSQYQMDMERIRELKIVQPNNNKGDILQALKQEFFKVKISQLKEQFYINESLMCNLKQRAQILYDEKFQKQFPIETQPHIESTISNDNDYLSLLQLKTQSYKHKCNDEDDFPMTKEESSNRQSSNFPTIAVIREQEQRERNIMQQKMKELAGKDSDDEQYDEEYSNYYEGDNQSIASYESPSKKRQVNKTSKQLPLPFLKVPQQQNNLFKMSKRKRERTDSPTRQQYRRESKSRIHRLYKPYDKVSRDIQRKDPQKSQWGKIVDYFSQDTISTNISGNPRAHKDKISSSFNQSCKPQQVPQLDSLFYKKHGQNQALLKESQFRKQECTGEEMVKRINGFDYKLQMQRWIGDKHFKGFINSQLVRIQNTISGSTFSTFDDEFEFDGMLYQVDETISTIRAFNQYREQLSGFNLYASNSKISQISQTFSIFWFLVTHELQHSPVTKHDLLQQLHTDFFTFLSPLNLTEFMQIRSFDYQTTIIMQIIMVLDLMSQENQNSSNSLQKDQDTVLGYMVQWTLKTLCSANLDQARSLMKKDLGDSIVILQLIAKAFPIKIKTIINQQISKLLNDINENSICSNIVSKNLQFSDWRYNQVCMLGVEKSLLIQALDIAIYAYQLVVFVLQYCNKELQSDQFTLDWQIVNQLLQSHSNTSQNSYPFSLLAVKQISNLFLEFPENLTQEAFVVIFNNYLKTNQSQSNGSNLSIKQMKENLNAIIDCFRQEQPSQVDILDVYLNTQDQRKLKQLHSKLTNKIPSDVSSSQSLLSTLKVHLSFIRYIQNDQQQQILFRRCLQLAKQEADKENSFDLYVLTQMIMELMITLTKVQMEDKGEPIESILTLIKKVLFSYNRQVLRNKGNLSQNEFLLKNNFYLMHLQSISRCLYFVTKSFKGTWKQHEYKWMDIQMLEEMYGVYAFLPIKSSDLEQMLGYVTKAYKNLMAKRTLNSNQMEQIAIVGQPIIETQQIKQEMFQKENDIENKFNHTFQQQDEHLAQFIVNQNLKMTVEKLSKSYMTFGKDIAVLQYLFALNGRVDAMFIESNNLKPSALLQKVQSSKYGSLSDNIDFNQKGLVISALINTYVRNLTSRFGFGIICSCNLNDQAQRQLIIQINYQILENFIRGLIMVQKDYKLIAIQTLKLYNQMARSQLNQEMIFKEQLENYLLQIFCSFQITENTITYEQISKIFNHFFVRLNKDVYQITSNKALVMNSLYGYVALLPILCKQFQELNNSKYQDYLDCLKKILLQFMVSFQQYAPNFSNISSLISQIISLVMPTFFGQNQQVLHTHTNLNKETNDAYYFYQYLSMQYENNPMAFTNEQNMKQFLDLMIRNIEMNLNELMPSLILNQAQNLEEIDKYILNECLIMKKLLDQICEISKEEFQKSLFSLGLKFLQININVDENQKNSENQKSQMKTLALVLLFTLIIKRAPENIGFQSSLNQLLTHLIYARLSQFKQQPDQLTRLDNNLNLLAILQSAQILTFSTISPLSSNILATLILLLLKELYLSTSTQLSKSSQTYKRITYYSESILNDFLSQNSQLEHGGNYQSNQFILRSSHRFVLNDSTLIEKMILKGMIEVLKVSEMNEKQSQMLKSLAKGMSIDKNVKIKAIGIQLKQMIKGEEKELMPENFKCIYDLKL